MISKNVVRFGKLAKADCRWLWAVTDVGAARSLWHTGWLRTYPTDCHRHRSRTSIGGSHPGFCTLSLFRWRIGRYGHRIEPQIGHGQAIASLLAFVQYGARMIARQLLTQTPATYTIGGGNSQYTSAIRKGKQYAGNRANSTGTHNGTDFKRRTDRSTGCRARIRVNWDFPDERRILQPSHEWHRRRHAGRTYGTRLVRELLCRLLCTGQILDHIFTAVRNGFCSNADAR